MIHFLFAICALLWFFVMFFFKSLRGKTELDVFTRAVRLTAVLSFRSLGFSAIL